MDHRPAIFQVDLYLDLDLLDLLDLEADLVLEDLEDLVDLLGLADLVMMVVVVGFVVDFVGKNLGVRAEGAGGDVVAPLGLPR